MTTLTLLSLALLLLPSAEAGKAVDESMPAAPDASISVENVCGSVHVATWDRDEVRVTGTIEKDTDTVKLGGGGARVSIELESTKGEDLGCAALEVTLPPGVRLELETVSADVVVAGVRGALDLETVSGDLEVQGEPAEVELETISGEVTVHGATAALAVETVSGDVEIHAARGRLEAETVSGEIALEGGPFTRVRVTTVSGDVSLGGTLEPAARLALDTHSGDVHLTVSPLDDVAWTLSTFSGRIEGDIGGQRATGFGPGTRLSHVQGQGTVGIAIATHSGDIEIR